MTTDTLTLADFTLARFIDDIALARQVQAQAVTDGIDVDDPRVPALVLARRVLAEIEAKRRIVDFAIANGALLDAEFACVHSVEQIRTGRAPANCYGTEAANDLLGLLALPYADHPDYRQEWRP